MYHNNKDISYFSKRKATLKILLIFKKGKEIQFLANQIILSSYYKVSDK